MKFEDLDFNTPTGLRGMQAKVFFSNGYGASVVGEGGSYGDGINTFELAVIKGNEESFKICYTTSITDDVLTYQTPDQITDLLQRIESLEDKEYNFEHNTSSTDVFERFFNALDSLKSIT